MTEEEWLRSAHPEHMLAELPSTGSARRYRLFAVACCRCVQSRVCAGPFHTAVDVAELYADGVLPISDLVATLRVTSDGFPDLSRGEFAAVRACVSPTACAEAAGRTLLAVTGVKRVPGGIRKRTAALLRDIFGNPYRPVAFDPAWRTDTAVSLARGMYDSRDFGAMPILADALQDAGCEDEQVLNHCRDATAPHVRGCWVCDLVLSLG
jgi:hypothetical protein